MLFGDGCGFFAFCFVLPGYFTDPDHTIGLFIRPTFHLKQDMLMPKLSLSQKLRSPKMKKFSFSCFKLYKLITSGNTVNLRQRINLS